MKIEDFIKNPQKTVKQQKDIEYHFKISEPNTWRECDIFVESNFKTYEKARETAIEKALTLIDKTILRDNKIIQIINE